MEKAVQANQAALDYHKSGFHCAEAVSKAIVEMYGSNAGPDIPKAATAFGGGVGRTKEDICGGLAGAFIAIGFLHGRSEAGADWTTASDLAARLREKFVEVHGTTQCSRLLEAFGPQDNMMRCKQLSGEIAGILADILDASAP